LDSFGYVRGVCWIALKDQPWAADGASNHHQQQHPYLSPPTFVLGWEPVLSYNYIIWTIWHLGSASYGHILQHSLPS
jgi:hypothetical protein